MLTRHGDEICDELFVDPWDEFREKVTPVDVTPCNKWLWEHDDFPGDLREDFGRVRLPWFFCWVEYVTVPDGPVGRHGQTLESAGPKEIAHFRSEIEDRFVERLFDNPEAENIVSVLCFSDHGRHDWTYDGANLLFLDEDGRLVSDREAQFFPMPTDSFIHTAGSESRARRHLCRRLVPVLFGFALAHAPNVTIWEDSKAEAVRENRKAKGQNPGQTFKCLDIEPFREEVRQESSEGESNIERARHKVRGHFKTYTEDAPLFGHTTGNVWCPPHERGTEEAGTVEKEYSVQSPNGD